MTTKTLIISAVIASTAMTANAQGVIPTYTMATLPNGISDGLFRGGAVFADVNNDGKMDMVVKGRDLNDGWTPKVQLALGGASGFASGMTLSEKTNIYESCLNLFDFNNDGNVDILLSCYSTPFLFKGNGNGTFTKMENFVLEDNFSISDDGDNKTADLYYVGLTITGDFDSDGVQDILTKNKDGNPMLYKGNGDGSFVKVEKSNLYAVRGGTMAVGDFNRDGYLDVAAAGWSDEASSDVCVVNKNNGDGTFTTIVSEKLVGAEKGSVMFADLDNDGYPELFVSGESSPEGWARIAYVFKNNGNGTFGAKTATNLPGACKGGVDWADVNGDGLIDIIYTGESNSNTTIVAVNNGSLSFAPNEIPANKVARSGAAVAAFDYDGDGIIDLAIMGYNDKAFLSKHFSVWNGSGVTANTAPTAPTKLAASSENGVVTFSWDAATDVESPAASLRYNVYVKFADGTVFSNVPADIESGKLRLGNVDVALTTTSCKLNVKAGEVVEWGVQAIDGGKQVSSFAKSTAVTGLNLVEHKKDVAPAAIYNLAGQRMNTPVKGLNLIKQADGKVKKVQINE